MKGTNNLCVYKEIWNSVRGAREILAMERPLISCYVLTYKNFDNIFLSIKSILEQDYPEIEIGVFDDGSENFPKDKIIDFIDSNKGNNIKNSIVFSNEKNMGTVRNMNNAVKMTKGKYLIWIPSDDRLYNNKSCSIIVDYFEKNDADIVTSFKQIVDDRGIQCEISPSSKSAMRILNTTAKEQFKWIATGAPITGAGTYYSRRIIERFGGFDEDYLLQEDGPFFLKATRSGVKIHFIQSVTYKYMLGNGVSSGSNNNALLVKDVLRMFEKEVAPNLEMFCFAERRRVKYAIERVRLKKRISWKERIKLLIRYPDVILYRIFNSH